MTTITADQRLAPVRSPRAAAMVAFLALLQRDFTVTLKSPVVFLARTILQPFLLVFVFAYVFPKIGQGVGGAASPVFATLLVAGVVGLSIFTQGIQSVALPMVQEFDYTREIEDRVLAPLPLAMVAWAKVVSGAVNGLLAAAIVFPIALFVPAADVHLHVDWVVLLTLVPLACLLGASLGLMFGTSFESRTVPLMFGVLVIPIALLGTVYYSWSALEAIPWLKIAVLVNPLVYINEGFRAAITPADHMPLWAIYPAMVGLTALFMAVGIRGFRKRVLS